MLAYKMWIGVLCFFLSINHLFSQKTTYRIDYLGPNEGLSQINVLCLLQDKRGLMWIGTENGLNLYDGYGFKIFRNNPNNTNTLSGNIVNTLLEDRSGMIWVGTSDGLSMYDPTLQKFYNFPHIPEDTSSLGHFDIKDIFEDSKGNIWIGLGIGLCRLIRENPDPNTWTFKRYNKFSKEKKPGPRELLGTTCNAIDEDSLGRVWFGFYTNVRGNLGKNTGAMSYFDYKDSSFHHFTDWNWEGKEGSDYEIHTLYKTQKGDFWIGTINQGLKKVEMLEGADSLQFTSYAYSSDLKKGLPHRFVRALLEDQQGNLWVGTFKGLAKMAQNQGTYNAPYFVPLQNPENESELQNPRINALYLDGSGIIWIGTEIGLYLMIPRQKQFKNYRKTGGENQGPIGNSTFGMAEAENGDIWMANYGKGLSRLITHADGSETFSYYGKEEGLIDLSVVNIDVDKEGHLWASTFGGVNEIIYENSEPKFVAYRPENNHSQGIKTPYVYGVHQDEKGNIWMANFTGGLDRLVKDSKETRFYNYMKENGDLFSLPSNRLTRVLGDRKDRVWVVTGGISLLYEGEDKALRFRHLFVDPVDKLKPLGIGISHLYLDEAGIYWMAGEKGLYKVKLLDAEKSPWEEGVSHLLSAEIKYYGVENGLPNQHVISILPDDKGNLWLSTYEGLSKFNPDTEQFRNYDYEDGLQGNEFNGISYLKTQKGEFLFGGINGITRFHPDSIQDSKIVAPAIITSFKLFNEEVPVGKTFDKTGFLLKQAISATDYLQLTHKEYVLSFEFVSPDFVSPQKVRYRYQLEGLESNWVEAGNRKFATYTNLKPGEYTFKVVAANADGVWQKFPTKIRLSVKPPPWLSWWAISLYMILGVGLLYAIFHARLQYVRREMKIQARIEQAKVEEREEVRARSSRDFHDEAGNRLSKISLYTGLSKRRAEKDGELAAYLEKIEENIGELSSGMRDFIWVLDPKNDKLQETVFRIQDFGQKLFEDTGIGFRVKSSLEEDWNPRLSVNSKRHILMIFKEAMNNTLKYASCNEVLLELSYTEELLTISLSDNGLGFIEDELMRVNGLDNMKDRAKEIGGELQIQSVPSLGTTIRLLYQIHPYG